MAGPLPSSRTRSSSVTSDIGATAGILDAEPTLKPDVSPISPRRGARGSLAFFFASKPDRSRTASPDLQVDTAQPPPQSDAPTSNQSDTKAARRNSRPHTFLARSLTSKPHPLSRTEVRSSTPPTLPGIFASLPSRTQDRIRSSYDSSRRSSGRPSSFTLGDITPIPDILDPETPSPEAHSFRLGGSFERDSEGYPKRRSMASFARPPITSRRISSYPLDGDDDLDGTGARYRASTADLIDFLRDTGPEDSHRSHVEKPASKDVDRDGASSTRSRSKSSIFRIAGRKREKSRPSIGAVSSNDVPPMPTVALPRLAIRQEDGEVRTSFSHILPLLNLNQESADIPGTRTSLQGSLSGQLPPNTREHRLPDGTTILMITTPQTGLQPKTLAHSMSCGSMTAPAKEEMSESMASGPENVAPQPPTLKPLVNPAPRKLKTHSPNMSVSSDGTLSTAERHRSVSGEDKLALLPRIRTLETQFSLRTPTTTHEVTGHSLMQNGLLQVHTPKTRPRGYSSSESASPPSAESTPTVSTPVPSFSPSASIAPTPELTPHKSPVNLPDSMPAVIINEDPAPQSSTGSPIIVDGLQFPAPPAASPQPRRRPNTIGTPPRGAPPVSPSRSSKSMRATRSPRRSNPSEGDLIKARAKKAEHAPRPSPLNLDSVPSYRELKANAAELQTQPGELTGLELDLSAGSSELGRKRDSLMEQHQQLFLNVNPFQTPPSPSDPFMAPPVRSPPVLPPPAGGPPAMPLPPSPPPLPEPSVLTNSPISPLANVLPANDFRRTSLHSQRSRLDSLRFRSSAMVTPIPASPVTSDAVHTLNTVLAAQRDQFDSMSKQLIDMVKAFEQEKRAYEQRIQELQASVADKEAKSKEDERKIKGLEWLVGNLNLRATVGQGGNNKAASSDSESMPAPPLERRRSSFSGLGAKDDVPVTPLAEPISRAFDPVERAKRAASMDDVLQNLIALSLPSSEFSSRNPSRIYEWAAQTAQEQD